MAEFVLSAFSDEYSPSFEKQLEGLVKNNIGFMEIRGVDGRNISAVTPTEAKELRHMADDAGIGFSAIGSPIGKIKIDGDMGAHMDQLRHICETACILGTKRIRMFSFYGPDNGNIADYREAVLEAFFKMLDIADTYSLSLCHENEKGIYGDVPERCLDLLESTGGRLKCVFDPANFIQSGAAPYPNGFELLKKQIDYMHIKDAYLDGTVTVAGDGVGGIPEILKQLNRTRNDRIFLTLEPHLQVFKGLSDLEGPGERSKLQNCYENSETAFAAAVAALRSCITD